MIEITTTVDGKEVPLNKFGDAIMDQMQKLVVENVKEQIEDRINNSGIEQERLDQAKISLTFLGDNVRIDIDGPEEIQKQIQSLFEDEEDGE